jgi:hypothetical protein
MRKEPRIATAEHLSSLNDRQEGSTRTLGLAGPLHQQHSPQRMGCWLLARLLVPIDPVMYLLTVTPHKLSCGGKDKTAVQSCRPAPFS